MTMDAYGQFQHAVVDDTSKKVLDELLANLIELIQPSRRFLEPSGRSNIEKKNLLRT
jgi:hypothetical protein